MTKQELLLRAYSAFNERDIDGVLALMSENVDWPKASEGGRVVGKQEIRDYWTRQWATFDPRVDVLEVVDRKEGKTAVKVRQVVKTLNGELLSDTQLWHAYSIVDGLIGRMDIEDEEAMLSGLPASVNAIVKKKTTGA